MPVSVRLDKLTILCNLGQSILPSDSDYWLKCATPYPYPRFREKDQLSEKEFQIIVIENSLVEYSFLPELGGRLVGVRDKRTGVRALRLPDHFVFKEGVFEHGIAFGDLLMSGFAPNATEFEIGHEEDSADSAAVLFYTTSPLLQVSSQVRVSLQSESPWLSVECSMLNRSLSSCQVQIGLAIGVSDQSTAAYGKDWLCASQCGDDRWVSIRFPEGDFAAVRRTDCTAELIRMDLDHHLVGAMNDSWSISLCPLIGISNVEFLTEEFGIGVTESRLTVVSQFGKPKCHIQLTSVTGESFQSNAQLYAEQSFHASIEKIGKLGSIGITYEGSQYKVSYDDNSAATLEVGVLVPLISKEALPWHGSSAIQKSLELLDLEEDPRPWARSARVHVGDRARASIILAIHACRQSDWNSSLAHVDEALSFEASNGLLWWMRAVVNRQKGETEEQPDRLNAHFLLPLEPALRAEAFLGQPAVPSMDPIPLVAPVALHDWVAAAIAGMYWNLGLFRDVVRWVDECCRHRESSWLRIIHAAAYLKLSGKEMEAHTQLQFAKRAGVGAPYPTTGIEFRILHETRAKFPGTEILEQWAEIVERVR